MAVRTLNDWVAREPVSAGKLNQQVEVLRALMRVMGWDENKLWTPGRRVQDFIFRIGKVTNAGPSGQADYTDERYWVRQVGITGGSPWDPLAFQDVPDVTYSNALKADGTIGDVTVAPVFTVSNVVELADHSHNLAVGAVVLFAALHDAGSSTGTATDKTPAARFVMATGGTGGVKFGTLTAVWSAGTNTVTLQPCAGPTDATATGAPNVSCFVQFPTNKPAPTFGGEVGDILAYQSAGGVNVLVAAPVLPRGTNKFQVLVNQGAPSASDWRPDFVRARGT